MVGSDYDTLEAILNITVLIYVPNLRSIVTCSDIIKFVQKINTLSDFGQGHEPRYLRFFFGSGTVTIWNNSIKKRDSLIK